MDLRRVRFLGAAAVKALRQVEARLRRAGRWLAVLYPNPHLRGMLEDLPILPGLPGDETTLEDAMHLLEPNLAVERSDTATGTLVRVRGEVDAYTCHELARGLRPLVEEVPRELLLDLAEVPFLDSAGVLALMDARRRLSRRGGELRIVRCSPAVRRVLTILRLSELFLDDTAPPAAPARPWALHARGSMAC